MQKGFIGVLKRLVFVLIISLAVSWTAQRDLPAFEEQDLRGNPVRDADFRNRVLVLNVWATWCAPCIAEFPLLQELYSEYAGDDRIRFAAIHCAVEGQSPLQVREFAERRKWTIPILYDADCSVDRSLGPGGLPRNFVIDRQGHIAAAVASSPRETFQERLKAAIEAELNSVD